jgi:hypothetical protein
VTAIQEQWGDYGLPHQRYALYWPADREIGACPGVVLLHGGGWKGGNLREHTGLAGPDGAPSKPSALAQHLAGLGYAAMSATYTIDPPDPVTGKRSGWPIHPLPMLDADTAWDWLAARARGRPSLVGNSAGALTALHCRRTADKRICIATPVGALPRESSIEATVGALFGTLDRSAWHTPTITKENTMLIHGSKDTTVPLWTLEYLRGDGVDVRVLDGAGHQPHTDERYRPEVWRLIEQRLADW